MNDLNGWMDEVLYGYINRCNNGWIEMDGLIDKINDKMDAWKWQNVGW